MKKFFILGLAAMLTGCLPTNQIPIMTTTTEIDLERYLGKWYEIATLPQFFSLGTKCVTADYSLNADGSIKVFNRQVNNISGQAGSITGKATVEPNSGNAKLKVSFFGAEPSESNYWIVEIADDYSYSVVSDPTKTTFWILSRTPQMDEAKVTEILNRWKAYGINTALVRRTVQDCW